MTRRLDSDLEDDLRKAVKDGGPEQLRAVLGIDKHHVPAPNDGACLFALFLAAYNGKPDMVAMLLDAGVDMNLRAPGTSWPALEVAAENGHTDTVRLMIGRGADLDVRATNGWTPLMAAAYHGRTAAARLLLDAGADVDAQSPDHYTAVVLATSANHPDTVKLLLERGADRNIRDRDGWLPLDYATQKEDLSDPSYPIYARDPELARLLTGYFPPPVPKDGPAAPVPRLVVPRPEKPLKLLPHRKGPQA